MDQYKWTEFYMELATKLLEYRDNRTELIQKIQKVYSAIQMKFPKLEGHGIPQDIDPFTTFGLFNKGISRENRMSIASGIAHEFQIHSPVPDNFEGIPLLNNLKATFYWFDQGKGEHDIDNLWGVFEAALALAENDVQETRKAFSDVYDEVLAQRGIQWNITMALYWIRPYTFINLDSRNRWYLSNPKHIGANVVAEVSKLKSVPAAEQYLQLRDKCMASFESGAFGARSFPELSYLAWVTSEEDNKREKKEAKNDKSSAEFLRWFRPLLNALRDLGGSATPADARAKIVDNEHLTLEEISVTRGRKGGNKFENDVAWARNYLRSAGYIDGSVRGVWTLTEKGQTVEMTDELASQVFAEVQAGLKVPTVSQESTLGDVDTIHYWLYAPGERAAKWDEFYKNGVMGLGWSELGDLNLYDDKTDIVQKLKETLGGESTYVNSTHAVWQFVHDLKPGDIVFAKKGRTEILGRGIVESDYVYDEDADQYPNIRKVKWTDKGNWQIDEMFAMKTLTDVTNYTDFVSKLNELFKSDEEDEETPVFAYPPYTVEDFLGEAYISEEDYHSMVGALRNKKNLILQGAPGVGKTFLAKRLAYSMMGLRDVDRVMMVQFHQSYSYEDFVMGIRPSESGFKVRPGAFYKFCKKAEEDSENDYFFIIDEINRGNLSKIFGELFMLIEGDKRGNRNKIQLLYSEELFFIPKNVYVIGMMNTADRSLAMIDYALRRRFSFFELKPGFSSEVFKNYQAGLDSEAFDRLIDCVERLNDVIEADESLGEGFCIGHSYFCNMSPETVNERLPGIIKFELIPMLKEYWFDEPMKVKEWSGNLRRAIK